MQLLEDNLQAQLHVERFSGTESWCAVVVADRVGREAQSASDGIARRRQIGAIEEVEHFDAELSAEPFRYSSVLHDREVHGGIAWPIVPVARARSKRSGSRVGKGRGIDPRYAALVEGVRHTGKRIADLVRALLAFRCAGRVRRGKHREG